MKEKAIDVSDLIAKLKEAIRRNPRSATVTVGGGDDDGVPIVLLTLTTDPVLLGMIKDWLDAKVADGKAQKGTGRIPDMEAEGQ